MSHISPLPSIYLNPTKTPIDDMPENTKAPQRIGRIWAELRNSDQPTTLMERLGMTRTDKKALDELLPIVRAVMGNDVVILPPHEVSTGVYFLSQNGQNIAVFKAGEKRARMELLVRHIAHKYGLEKHAIPGLFCSMANPIFPREDMSLELHSGNQKVFRSSEVDRGVADELYNKTVRDDNETVPNPFTLTGILEPFLPANEEITLDDMAKMTLLALIVGMRDAKSDGIAGARFFDVEECMPWRLYPQGSPDKKVAATHLPFLENQLAHEPLSKETLEALVEIAKTPMLFDLVGQLVMFPDLAAETLDPEDPTNNWCWDHGGCRVIVEPTPQILDGEKPKILDEHNSESFRLLSEDQIITLETRRARLVTFLRQTINSGMETSCIQMVRAADPFFDEHYALASEAYGARGAAHVVGRETPDSLRTPISADGKKRLADGRRSLSFEFPCEHFPGLTRGSSAPPTITGSTPFSPGAGPAKHPLEGPILVDSSTLGFLDERDMNPGSESDG